MTRVRVLGLDVKVEPLTQHSENFGEWSYVEETIRLGEGLSESRRGDILWHELLHVISDRLSLSLSEKQVQRIAAAQIAVLRDNPELLGLLSTGDSDRA